MARQTLRDFDFDDIWIQANVSLMNTRRPLPILGVSLLAVLVAAAPVTAATAITHGSRTVKTVALTFDDGYSASRTRAILAILVKNKVPATFFPNATSVKAAPATWWAVANAGYPIGNHTMSHKELPLISSTSVRAQICNFRKTVEPIIGRKTIDWFRPPYGSWNSRVATIAAGCGYRHMLLWDVDTRDWSGISASAIATRALAGTKGSIILLHAGPANTPYALQRIINGYKARGYTFVTIPQMLGTNG